MAIYLNPCGFYQAEQPVSFHRKVMAFLIVADFVLMMVLRLLSIFFHNQNKQRVDEILKNHVIGKQMIKVEEIKNVEGTQTTGIGFFPEKQNKSGSDADSKGKDKKAEDKEESSESSASSDDGVDESQIKPKEKYAIDLKKLKIGHIELIDIYSILIGHRAICLAFAMLYYPFFHATILGLLQSTLLLIYFFIRRCVGINKVTNIIKGIIYFINLAVLSLALRGMKTNVPNAAGNSCLAL